MPDTTPLQIENKINSIVRSYKIKETKALIKDLHDLHVDLENNIYALADDPKAQIELLSKLNDIKDQLIENHVPVSYTHLTLPTKRIV